MAVRRGGARSEYRVHLIDIVDARVTPTEFGESVLPSHESCGIPNLEGCRKVLPEYDAWAVEVRRRGKLLWEMDVLRSRASSGLNKSGIEVRRVRFRGKPVLSRGHVPILNVEYQQNDRGCGPSYRDWFGDEACFQASGTDFVGGLRICDKPPVTIVDSDSSDADEGSFRGLAIHATDDELVFTSETKAAWYRYISQWRFADDGAIRPRLSFGATDNPCTCLTHTHHAYWRFDFSWPNAAIKVTENNPAMPRPRLIRRETRLAPRVPGYTLQLAGLGDRPWKLLPGPHDGTASPYGRSDGWLLRSNPLEIDDLQGFDTKHEATAANLDRYLTGEKTDGSPVTLWYGAHHGHDCGCTSVGETLGPDLMPDRARW